MSEVTAFRNSFTDILAEEGGYTVNQQLSTPYVPAGAEETWNSAYRPLGLPRDPLYFDLPAGLDGAGSSAVSSISLSSLDGIWDSVSQNSLGAFSWAGQKAKGLVTSSYGLLKEGVSEVLEDVTTPLSSGLKTYYWYLLGGLIVVGGVLYFAGKGGAIRVTKAV